jgi:cephalosporin-C deacetylase
VVEPPYAGDPPAPTLYDDDPALLGLTRPDHDEPEDFDSFWGETLEETRTVRPHLRRRLVDTGLVTVAVEDVTFPGWGGQPVRGWLLRPAARADPLPVVVQFCGYRGGRGLPLEHLTWASAGYAHLVMDSRGQGVDTPDAGAVAPGPDGEHVVRGISSPATYYYRRLIADAVRAVDCLRLDHRVDPARVVIAGASQGGGLALAVAALVPDIALLLCDVPFLCHWPRALQVADRGPYAQVAGYCAQHPNRAAAALATLRYFDGRSFARRAHAPATFSVALRDRVCPPSTVLAAFDAYAGADKELLVHPDNGHEGGGPHQLARNLARARTAVSPTAEPGPPRQVAGLPSAAS